MSGNHDLSATQTAPELAWPEVRAWLQAQPRWLLEDRALLEELGLRLHGRNVVEFGPAALTRLEAVVQRESGARKQIEQVARANFAAQTQTHVAALDLMEARNHSDLARRLDAAAQARFGLAGAAVALEKPGGVPFGWKALEPGRVDALLGPNGLTWLGPAFPELDLFGASAERIDSPSASFCTGSGESQRSGRSGGSREPDACVPSSPRPSSVSWNAMMSFAVLVPMAWMARTCAAGNARSWPTV